jgi:hypothetical protein
MPLVSALSANLYALTRAQVFWKGEADTTWMNLGDCESFTLNMEVEEIERFAKDSAVKIRRRSDVLQVTPTISMTLLQLTPFLQAARVLGDYSQKLTQTVGTNIVETFTGGGVPGALHRIAAWDATIVSVTDGAGSPVPYVAGTNFTFDEKSGMLEITSKPGGSGANVVVTYNRPAITAGERLRMGVAQQAQIKGSLMIRGVGSIGPQSIFELWNSQIRPEGDLPFIGADEYDQVTITGRLFADNTKATGYEYGQLVTL